jgi:hypothetical protein
MGSYTWNGTHGIGYYNDSTKVFLGIGSASNQNKLFGIGDPAEGSLSNYPRFNGNVSNVKIYNYALSDEEIYKNFEATRGRYNV